MTVVPTRSSASRSAAATAARTAVLLADGRAEIVSGSWKKMPPEIKGLVRRAIEAGDASCLIDAANAGGGGDNITAVILTGETKE